MSPESTEIEIEEIIRTLKENNLFHSFLIVKELNKYDIRFLKLKFKKHFSPKKGKKKRKLL